MHMAENIYELFPLFPHHIFYAVRLCVVQNKSLQEGRGGEGKKAVQGLEIHQVPGTLVVGGSWGLLASGWLAAVKGIPPPPFCSPFPPLRGSLLEGEFQMPTRKELTSSCCSAFFHIPFTLTRAESSTATVSQPGCRQPKKIIKLYRGQIEPESGE